MKDQSAAQELIERSDAAIRTKNYGEGLKFAEEARKRWTNTWEAYANISTALHKQGNTKEALKVALEGNQKFPKKGPILENIADVYWHMNNPEKALLYFRKTQEVEPNNERIKKWIPWLIKKYNLE